MTASVSSERSEEIKVKEIILGMKVPITVDGCLKKLGFPKGKADPKAKKSFIGEETSFLSISRSYKVSKIYKDFLEVSFSGKLTRIDAWGERENYAVKRIIISTKAKRYKFQVRDGKFVFVDMTDIPKR